MYGKAMNLSKRKLYTYYLAVANKSRYFPKIQVLVAELYPELDGDRAFCLSLAIFHACRNAHRQGYILHWLDVPSSPKRTAAVRRYVAMFKQSTIDCWQVALQDPANLFREARTAYNVKNIMRRDNDRAQRARDREITQRHKEGKLKKGDLWRAKMLGLIDYNEFAKRGGWSKV